MIQLGEAACAVKIDRGGEGRRRVGAGIIAAVCAISAIAVPKTARGEDETGQPAVDAAAQQRAEERATCSSDLEVASKAIEHDYKYARNWTDAWYVIGASLGALSFTSAFQFNDYRRAEGIVNGAQALLLMIQVPTATSSKRALKGIRAAASEDPCLALADARYILETNADDRVQHTNTFAYVFSAVLPLVSAGILAVSTKHWDFTENGAEGIGTVVGLVAGELQVITFPGSSLKVTGTSLQMKF